MKPSIIEQLSKKFKSELKLLTYNLEKVLNILNRDRTNQLLIDEAFRHIHSINGAAAMMGYKKTSELSQVLEYLYDFARKEIFLTEAMLELTYESVRMLQMLIENEEKISRDNGYQYTKLLNNLKDTRDEYQKFLDWKKKKYSEPARLQ